MNYEPLFDVVCATVFDASVSQNIHVNIICGTSREPYINELWPMEQTFHCNLMHLIKGLPQEILLENDMQHLGTIRKNDWGSKSEPSIRCFTE